MAQHTADGSHGFLAAPEETPEVVAAYADDLASDGYVMNLTRVWAHLPEAQPLLSRFLEHAVAEGGLTFRDRAVLVSATAATLGDSYCSLAWGGRLAGVSDEETAAAVVRGDDAGLDERERVLAAWARAVTDDPNATSSRDVEALREVGYDDRAILAITLYVAGRIAFSTVNDALGARPDRQLAEAAPGLADAIDFGRPVAGQ